MDKLIQKEEIENLIYEVKGKKVMLDSDLAKLYECANGTKDINKAVKRNINRFPDDFCFQLLDEETSNLWFQIGTAKNMNRTNPHVFTEQGVAMLAATLHTKVANKVSINIMRAFVNMRKYISNDVYKNNNNNNILVNHENRILKLEEIIDKMNENSKINTLFFEGQIYDAYSLLMDILNKARKEIIIIDNYAGKEMLDIIKNVKAKITIVSSNVNSILKNKYEKQYSNVEFIINNSFHDRFIIIDRSLLYNSGASFKDLGKKCFALNKIESNEILNELLNRVFK